jgi:3-hydroxyacyl-[acyl-carrier protein] dehydratase/trans-2-decenoyl-[acyl-carrier protein] isomerase
MLDRVVEISRQGNRGRVVGEREVRLDDWFFQCHFLSDPVQPGCLGVDAVWQLLGFFCIWAGGLGSGRALGCGEIEFFGQIRPHDRLVRVEIDVRRYAELPETGSAIAIGDATLLVDGEPIYSVKRAKTGLFRDIAYRGYPNRTEHSRGGRMER